jgi:hypothetical protein
MNVGVVPRHDIPLHPSPGLAEFVRGMLGYQTYETRLTMKSKKILAVEAKAHRSSVHLQ